MYNFLEFIGYVSYCTIETVKEMYRVIIYGN